MKTDFRPIGLGVLLVCIDFLMAGCGTSSSIPARSEAIRPGLPKDTYGKTYYLSLDDSGRRHGAPDLAPYVDLINRQLKLRGLVRLQSAESNPDYLVVAGLSSRAVNAVGAWSPTAPTGGARPFTTGQYSGDGSEPARDNAAMQNSGSGTGAVTFTDWIYTFRLSVMDQRSSSPASTNLPYVVQAEGIGLPLNRTIPGLIEAAFRTAEPGSEKQSPPAATASTGDIGARLPYVIEFTILPQSRSSRFSAGDEIVITSVTGDHPDIQVGGIYLVEGTYTLASMDEAILGLSVPYRNGSMPWAHTSVSNGKGHFSLRIEIPNIQSFQSLHLAFYTANRGYAGDGIHFVGKGSRQNLTPSSVGHTS